VYDRKGEVDTAFIEADSGQPLTWFIAAGNNSDNQDIPVAGIIPDETLRNNVNNNYKVYVQGASSCRDDAYIKATEKHNFTNVHAVMTEHGVQGGDSGGPMFRKEQNSSGETVAKICGSVNGDWDLENDGTDDDAHYTTAETIEERIGGTFYTG
jgi:hypothetical protein